MKRLMPSLRDNYRYILCRVLPVWVDIDPKEAYYAINETVRGWTGDIGASKIQPVVVYSSPGEIIVRCIRGGEKDLTAILLTVFAINEKKVVIRPVKTSGTIHVLKRYMKNSGWEQKPPEEILVSGTPVTAYTDRYGRIDIPRDGAGPKQLRFITTHEVEGA